MTAEHAIDNDANEQELATKKASPSKRTKRTAKQKANLAENTIETPKSTGKTSARKHVSRKKSSAVKAESNSSFHEDAPIALSSEEGQHISTSMRNKKQTERRKKAIAGDISTEDIGITAEQGTDNNSAEEKIAPSPTRKRGRPRKSAKQEAETLHAQHSDISTANDANHMPALNVEKRKTRATRRALKPKNNEQAPLMFSAIKDINEVLAEIGTDEPRGAPEINVVDMPTDISIEAAVEAVDMSAEQSQMDNADSVAEPMGVQADTDNNAVTDIALVSAPVNDIALDNIATDGSTQDAVTPMNTSPDNNADNSPDDNTDNGEETALSPKRGRRGGRGKRGKKRAELAQFPAELEDEIPDAPLPKKNIGSSLSTDKPGIAHAATNKKSQENAQRKMLISMVQGEQVEVALVEHGIIHEYYLEMLHQVKSKGNIYKGVVNNIDTNLQAAFINYGNHKNGFLQIDEIHPEYYQSHHETVRGKKFPPIQKIIKPGQEILVQVVKEPTGNKGAFLTTWLSLAGRFLVLTPGQEQIGVSRKVDNDEERSRLRDMMTGIDPGKGLGVIVRTVSAGTSKTTLKSDLQYLKRVWKEIRKRGVSESAPALLHMETNLSQRAIRDYLTDDVSEVWVDSTEMAENLRETVSLLFPKKKELIRIHADVRQTLWERFNMQRQLEQIYAREVHLPSGGRLVFDQTEALMAIDINSGKISGKGNFEAMALKTNLEAAETIARHLKLRDIGGQVVIDFIEMRERANVREVEKTLKNAMKNDRARHDVARMSSFGLLEIVRQRTGSSALANTMEACPHCRGTGIRRNLEWQALQALCEIERKGRSAQGNKYIYETQYADLALYLLNNKRQRISELEMQLKVSIEIRIR